MEEVLSKADGLVSHIKEYVEVRVEEVKLEVADRSSKVMAAVIARIVVFLVLGFFILFASTAVAYVLGGLWGKMWLGFLVVSGFYALLALLVWLTRDTLIRIPMVNTLLKQMTKKDDDDDDND